MKLYLSEHSDQRLNATIAITGSKSESNRSLLLQALYPNLNIANISNSDDAKVMQKGLAIKQGVVDIHHAGTAMRFLTGYFAAQEGKEVTLTGSQRMTERPVKVLVDALLALGADIHYLQNEGYPPIYIKGKKLTGTRVSLPANISSQYISSLLLNAPSLENGLTLKLVGKITSVPYINMTLGILTEIGVRNTFEGNTIQVMSKDLVITRTLTVESDWSSASYFYSCIALAEVGSEIMLSAYKRNSLQGDSVLAEIYTQLGVETIFGNERITIRKISDLKPEKLIVDLSDAPDIAQTIAVTCFGLGLACHLTGLHTLKIKETDRLEALHTELSKLGADISVTNVELDLSPSRKILAGVTIETYNDHRMAMAFAPLAMKTSLYINDAGVVSKSYPDFWKDMETLGFRISETDR